MVNKGTISTLKEGGKKASIKPYMGDVVTPDLVVPFFLFESLEVGMPVVYVSFEDGTGVVLARMDGEWSHKVNGDIEVSGHTTAQTVVAASVSAAGQISGASVLAGSVSLGNHTHTYDKDGTGTGTTSRPQ